VKWLSRIGWLRTFVAWTVSSYLDWCARRVRWTFEGCDPLIAVAQTPQGLLACFWHKTITLSPIARQVAHPKAGHAMVSLSSDGELIAQIIARLGYPSVRGSRGKEGARDKGGTSAFRQSLRFLQDGDIVVITPDGPRGPDEHMGTGAVTLSQTAGVPTFLVGFAVSPAIRPNTWDHMMIPWPFGRGAMVVDGPIAPLAGAGEAEIAAETLLWEARLKAVQRRAEAMVA
jgi:lysophospholipid acyltransferase (LPLAT)-like uncharacterized protein